MLWDYEETKKATWGYESCRFPLVFFSRVVRSLFLVFTGLGNLRFEHGCVPVWVSLGGTLIYHDYLLFSSRYRVLRDATVFCHGYGKYYSVTCKSTAFYDERTVCGFHFCGGFGDFLGQQSNGRGPRGQRAPCSLSDSLVLING